MSDKGGLPDLPDRVLEFLSQHGGWSEALAYVHRIEVENRLRANAVDRWVPCADHRDKTERGKCYVCENERLQRKLSAHGQPVVDECALMAVIEEIRSEAEILAIDEGRGPLPLAFYLMRYTALTGDTP